MLKDIDTIDPQSGRILKEDNLTINIADIIAGANDLTGGIRSTCMFGINFLWHDSEVIL